MQSFHTSLKPEPSMQQVPAAWRQPSVMFKTDALNITDGLEAAIRYVQSIGFDKIQERELLLTRRAFDGLTSIPHVTVLGSKNPEEHTGILSFTVDQVHPHDVSAVLESDGIAVRAGHHCAQPLLTFLGVRSATRASLMFYNTEEEVDTFLKSVSTIRRRMGYGE